MPTYDPATDFDPVLFIKDGTPLDLNPALPYVYNAGGGQTEHLAQPKGELIRVATEDPRLRRGHTYTHITWTERVIDPGETWAYKLTVFDFHPPDGQVAYEGIWADREACRAFGITLLQPGQCVPFSYDGLIKSKYTYGVWAGHQSPYIEKKRRRQLLTINATDLEYHAFPHLFNSQDDVPLVISVARWRPEAREISLADLWVRPGDCLYLPPKHYRMDYVDMHGNRNSALACWDDERRLAIETETTLGNSQVFEAPETKPHYHSEPHATVHLRPR